jgi:hypothetical protein
MDARDTLKLQDKELESQRREIEELRRQLAKTDPDSALLILEDNQSEAQDDEQSMEDEAGLNAYEPSTPRSAPQKRKTPPSNRSSVVTNATAELPEMTIGDVEGVIAEMAAELTKEGTLAEGAMAEMAAVGKSCQSKEIELMNMEDIDAFEFDSAKSADTRVLEAPWSGLPMVTSTEAVLGHCAIPL